MLTIQNDLVSNKWKQQGTATRQSWESKPSKMNDMNTKSVFCETDHLLVIKLNEKEGFKPEI